MPYLQSQALEAVTYDEDQKKLRARFRSSGETAVYDGVPQDVYDSLLFADSIGSFFKNQIEGHYPVTRR